jgi:prepilin-type N-terminal cleavage/methylation domain-containing protein
MRRTGRTPKAFTLLELLLTIAIASVLTGLAVSTLHDTLSLKREAGAARTVASLLKRGRALAVATHSRVQVATSTASSSLTLNACKSMYGTSACVTSTSLTPVASGSVTLNRGDFIGVQLTSAPASALVFNASGFAEVSGTYTYVVDEAGRPGSFNVVVSTAGEVSVQ